MTSGSLLPDAEELDGAASVTAARCDGPLP